MDMVAIGAHLFKDDVIAFLNGMGDFLNCCGDWCGEQRLAVFDGKDDVIVGVVYAVVASDDAHAGILSFMGFYCIPAASRRVYG